MIQRLLVVLLLIGVNLWSQEQQLAFLSTAPSPPSTVGASAYGARGGTMLYYWVIARYPAGASSAAMAAAFSTVGGGNLTGSNFVRVSWAPVAGATGYDVLRSDTPLFPGPSCAACAVVLNTASTSVDDTGGPLSAYPPGGLNAAVPVTAFVTVNNRDEATPYVNLQLLSIRINEVLRVGLISGTPAENDCMKWAGGRLVSAGAACGSGSGSGSADFQVTATSASVATVAAGNVRCLDSSGLYAVSTLSSGTVTRNSGSASGTIRYAVNCNSGSPIIVARIDTGITLGNYGCSGVTCTSGNSYLTGDIPVGSIVVSSGNNGTATDLRTFVDAADYSAGTGLTKTGNVFSVNSAVVGFLATANTWTAKQTFTPSGTLAGANLGSLAGDPSSPVDGDIWYNSTTGKFRCRQNSTTSDCVSSGGSPGGSNTQIQFNNAGSFAGDSGLTWDNTNKVVTISRSNSGGAGGRLVALNSASGPNFSQHSTVDACIEGSTTCAQVLFGYFNNYLGAGDNAYWTVLRNLFGSDIYHVIGRKGISYPVTIGGDINTANGWLAVTSSGVSRFANSATAGLGLAPIMAAPTELTGQSGDVAAQTLLATSHTAGMYRVCGFVAVTGTGTGNTVAWTLSWRSPASGSDLTHNLFWSAGAAETDTFAVTATNEFNVCKVIRSTGASAILLNPGDMNTSTYTTAWTVERLR